MNTSNRLPPHSLIFAHIGVYCAVRELLAILSIAGRIPFDNLVGNLPRPLLQIIHSPGIFYNTIPTAATSPAPAPRTSADSQPAALLVAACTVPLLVLDPEDDPDVEEAVFAAEPLVASAQISLLT
jgi:hypothetical protein